MAAADPVDSAKRSLVGRLLDLAKVRLAAMVTLTAAGGYLLAIGPKLRLRDAQPLFDGLPPILGAGPAGLIGLWRPVVGCFLLACGSGALNQVQDAAYDRRMTRTCDRPVASGRLRPATAAFVAVLLMLAGVAVLTSSGRDSMTLLGLAVLAAAWYNGVYTYLKRVTAFAAVPGALIGAIPPLIGWAAAGGSLADPYILAVAGFFFIWQIPHFWLLLLTWGRDFERAGLPSLIAMLGRGPVLRITFMWVAAAAAAGVLLSAAARQWVKPLPRAAIIVAAAWLVVATAFAFQAAGSGAGRPDSRLFRRAFIRINVFAVAVLACLVVSAMT